MSEELKNFAREASGGEPAAEAANARVLARFAAAGAAPEGAKARVLAALEARRKPLAPRLVPAFAISAAVVAAFLLLRPGARPEPLLSTDWLSYDNFPYYSDEARQYLNPADPEERSLEGLIPSAEDGF
ncbi:MAG TPA: hypothetical protein DCZ92_03120 [Elusimicrobia bacterium]|nr:hypothetical protein [Elusimicrobiota bacterium]